MKKLMLILVTVTFVTASSVVVNGQSVKQKTEVSQKKSDKKKSTKKTKKQTVNKKKSKKANDNK